MSTLSASPELALSVQRGKPSRQINDNRGDIVATPFAAPIEFAHHHVRDSSGVSWAAVVAGAVTGAALSLVLLALGTGLGLSAVSPWANAGVSAATAGTAAIAWMVFVQFVGAALGGYLAGRLRTKWIGVHQDEVHFRDTAHGLLAWSVSVVLTAYFLASASASMAGSAAQASASTSNRASSEAPYAYYTDTLFRQERADAAAMDAAMYAEASRLFAHSLMQDEVSGADRTYLGRLVAARTGLSQAEAEKRVSDTILAAKQASDALRKATSHLLLWAFVALLIGAFSASYAATIGGRQRDNVQAI